MRAFRFCLIPFLSLAVCLLAPLVLPAPRQNSPIPESTVIRSTTRLVQVSVVVTDKNGEPVAGLKKEDFTVLDEGKSQEIAFFSGQAPPRAEKPPALPPNVFTNRFDLKGQYPGAVTIVLFDSLNTSVQDQGYVRAQVIKFLKDLKPQDHVAVYALTTELLVLHEFTQDSSALVAAAGQFQPKEQALFDASHPVYFDVPALKSDPGWVRFQEKLNEAHARMASESTLWRARMTADAFEAIAKHVAAIAGRKNLVWVSGSFPLSIRPSETTSQYSQAASRALNSVNTALYPVDATGVTVTPSMDPSQVGNSESLNCPDCINEAPVPSPAMYPRENNRDTERMIADATGGLAFYGSNDITKALKRAFDDGRYAYTIAFYPNHGQWDEKYRSIEIHVKASGAQLRYRRGYFAESEHADSEPQAKAELLEAAASPLDATRLGLIVTGKLSGTSADRKIELRVELDPKQLLLQEGRDHRDGTVDLCFVQRDSKGEAVAAETQRIGLHLEEKQYEHMSEVGLTLAKHLVISPSTVELRVLVRDAGTEALGSVAVPVTALLAGTGAGEYGELRVADAVLDTPSVNPEVTTTPHVRPHVRVLAEAPSRNAPHGWHVAGTDHLQYEAGVDPEQAYEGQMSAFLKSNHPHATKFGTLMQTISADGYLGVTVRLSGLVKSEGVKGWAGLWMRVDVNGRPFLLDNMHDRPIKGTNGWKRYEIVLNVPTDATSISFGMLLSGTGEIWLNNTKLEIVGMDVPSTASGNGNTGPVNLDFSQ